MYFFLEEENKFERICVHIKSYTQSCVVSGSDQTFRRDISLPSSDSKNMRSELSTWRRPPDYMAVFSLRTELFVTTAVTTSYLAFVAIISGCILSVKRMIQTYRYRKIVTWTVLESIVSMDQRFTVVFLRIKIPNFFFCIF